MFERFALPSVRAQTCQQFHWLLLGDSNTPPQWRSRFESLLSDNMEFLWLADRSESLCRITELRAPHQLTTRLDTDDAISRDFLSRLQKAARKTTRRYFLNMPDGLLWYNGCVTRRRHYSNQFISCCEPFDAFSTVHCGPPHTKLSTVGHVTQIGAGEPAWMYTYQGHNSWNRGQHLDAADWLDESNVADRFCIDTHIQLTCGGHPSPASPGSGNPTGPK